MVPEWWSEAVEQLKDDELLGPLIHSYKGEALKSRGNVFYSTCRSIIGQQISVKAAQSIWNRLEKMLGEVTPERILQFTQEELRSCGLTRSKADYIHGLADKSESFLDFDYYDDDEELIKHFSSFRGIGRWTAEMILIFSLLRPDVFSKADIGLIRAVEKFELPEDIMTIAERWRPWRSAAAWYLWRSLDPIPVEY